MLEFKSHASGSTGNFYTVRDREQTVAIECGIALDRIQKGCDFRLSEIEACLISHEH